MNGLSKCPRCGDHAFEHLGTYAHCVGCLYFEDGYTDSERAYFEARQAEQLYLEAESSDTEEKDFDKAS